MNENDMLFNAYVKRSDRDAFLRKMELTDVGNRFLAGQDPGAMTTAALVRTMRDHRPGQGLAMRLAQLTEATTNPDLIARRRRAANQDRAARVTGPGERPQRWANGNHYA